MKRTLALAVACVLLAAAPAAAAEVNARGQAAISLQVPAAKVDLETRIDLDGRALGTPDGSAGTALTPVVGPARTGVGVESNGRISKVDGPSGASSADRGDADTAAEAGVRAELRTKAGVAPDSFLYPLVRAWERIRLWFAGSGEAKAELYRDAAEKRLAEARVMLAEGKQGLAAEAHAAYLEALDAARRLTIQASTTAIAESSARLRARMQQISNQAIDLNGSLDAAAQGGATIMTRP